MVCKSGLIALASLGLASAAGRTSAPSGCISVPDDYSTIQAAVDSLSSASGSQCIYIAAGTYSEQVFIDAISAQLTIYGETSDTSTYTGNKVTITSGLSQDDGLDNDGTATVRAHADGLTIYNVNIENSFGQGSQAVALSAYGNEQGYYGVSLTGYQDTLLAQTGNQVYVNSYIEGAVDFIFGQEAVAWFSNCEIYATKAGGSITANGRASADGTSYYVFDQCTVDGSASSGTVYLGRPWRAYARVTFQDSTLTDVIASAGWSEWSSSDPRTDGVEFVEYGNTGSGASTSGRASFATVASSAVEIATLLGSGYSSWVDSSYL